MTAFDDLTERLTRRLRMDAELRMEVARELRTHLEDAAEEYRHAGADGAAAQVQAIKALGDENELAESLWQANRGRMRLRAVARWAATAALLPAAVATVVLLLVHAGVGVFSDPTGLPGHWLKAMSPDERLILLGDANASTPATRLKALVDRWPDNPVYYANYVSAVGIRYETNRIRDANRLAQVLELADKGEKIDPNNGFYNVLKATWLIGSSGDVEDDPSRIYTATDRLGKATTRPMWKVTVRDGQRFQQGIAELRRGLAKPELTGREIELTTQRMSLLPQARNMTELLAKSQVEMTTVLGQLSQYREMAKAVSAYAIGRAAAGDACGVDLAHSVEVMGNKLGAGSSTITELLVAQAIRSTTLAGMEQVGKELGDGQVTARALEQRQQSEQLFRDIWAGPVAQLDPHAGILWGVLTPSIPGYQAVFEPLRTTEYCTYMEAALMLLLVLLVVVSAVFGVATIWGAVAGRGGKGPVLVFVGWRRIAWIMLVSVILPLASYGVYAWWLVATAEAYGINYAIGRVLLEWAVVVTAVIVLLLATSYRAIRQRCMELGVEVPEPITARRRWVLTALGAIAVLAVAVCIVGWWAGPLRTAHEISVGGFHPFISYATGINGALMSLSASIVLAAAVLGLGVLWVLRELVALLWCGRKVFRRTFFRSAMPILCSAAIVAGVAVGGALSLGEASAVGRVTGLAGFSLANEVDRTGFRQLRQAFVKWHDEDKAQNREAK